MAKFQVDVTRTGRDATELIKALRVIAELELKEAKALADLLAKQPSTLVAGVDEDVARHIASLLGAAGAEASVQASGATAPLFLHPPVNGKFEWSRLKGRVPVK